MKACCGQALTHENIARAKTRAGRMIVVEAASIPWETTRAQGFKPAFGRAVGISFSLFHPTKVGCFHRPRAKAREWTGAGGPRNAIHPKSGGRRRGWQEAGGRKDQDVGGSSRDAGKPSAYGRGRPYL